jgi:hypothetical protein
MHDVQKNSQLAHSLATLHLEGTIPLEELEAIEMAICPVERSRREDAIIRLGCAKV